MGTLLFGALLFQIKFKIVLKDCTSHPTTCVAASFVFPTSLFRLVSIPFHQYNVTVLEIRAHEDGFSGEIIHILS